LQAPLQTISNFTNLLVKKYQERLDDKAKLYIKHIHDGVAGLKAQIQDLLQYSQVDRCQRAFELVDLKRIWQQVRENLQAAIATSSAIISCAPLPIVKADPSQMVRLWQNLLDNGIKYCQEKLPRIEICASQQEGEWLFAIRDNGIGIPKKYRERIFLIFQRLHAQDEYPGTGIGLAICQKIVERHGGRIWVESEIDCGSTFYFTLPAIAKESTNA